MAEGYLLKLGRAEKHLDHLKSEVAKVVGNGTYAVVNEPDEECGAHQYRCRVVLKNPETLPYIAVLAGEVLYCLRSALDSEFPIFGRENKMGEPVSDWSKLSSQFSVRTAGMSDGAKAIIKGLQPYFRGDKYTGDSLWHLKRLCDIDKHQRINVLAFAVGGLSFQSSTCENVADVRDFWANPGPLEREAIVARYLALPVKPDREVKVNLNPALEVAFADGIAEGEPVYLGLLYIYNYVWHVVDTLVQPPKS